MKTVIGKIEEMPVGATFTGIVTKERTLRWRVGNINSPVNSGQTMDFYEPAEVDRSIRFKPARIEVDDEAITLLRGKNFGYGRYSANAEIGIKKGVLVEWEI